MRGDTQANRLEVMMQRHQRYPNYTLSLPLFEVKKSILKKLHPGDILYLGLDRLSLVLLDEKGECAEVSLEEHNGVIRLMITAVKEHFKQKASKKYQVVTVAFGRYQSRKIEVGHMITAIDLCFDDLIIEVEGKKIAQGSLINAEGKICVKIDKVIV